MDPELEQAPFRDPELDLARRAADLLGRMTLDEKLAQLGGVWSTALVEDDSFSSEKAAVSLRHGIGHVARIAGSTGLRPTELARFANRIQRWLSLETRLGIPAIVHEESTAGFTARDATQLPQAIGLASTWDPDLVERCAQVIRHQMCAVGARQSLAPVLDIARDPRWGRTEETYGEDPYLTGRIGVAYVRGLQGDDLRKGVAATAKHFLGYGASEGGHNHKPAHIGARALREVFARPFAAVIAEADLASVMNAYNDVDGLPCGGSSEILQGLLRDELGFEGIVVADYFTTLLLVTSHRIAASKREAARVALRAGLDLELPALDAYGAPLREALDAGEVPISLVDRSVERVLRLKLSLGLFERAVVDETRAARSFQTRAQRELAREAARRSMVLLRNEGGLLPLDPALSCIAVLGPCADDPRLLQGDYSYPAHLEILYQRSADAEGVAGLLPRAESSAFAPGPYFVPMVTPRAGIGAAVSRATRVLHAPGCDVLGDDRSGIRAAVAAAREADVAVVCVGGRSGLLPGCTSGEFRDAADLGLTGVQQELVEAVVSTRTPTVVVLVGGRVLALPRISALVPALVQAWLPGEEGGSALADLLFGTVSPSGRLPICVPRSVGQVPLYAGRKWGRGGANFIDDYSDLPAEPLFPFGHGLSYTRFEYGELAISPARARADERVEIAFDLANVGERDGEEVAQLYVQDLVASTTRPARQLAGFARVPLAAGASRRVRFALDPAQLALYDPAMRLVVEPGDVEVRVGASSEDIRRSGRFRIEGPVRPLSEPEIRPTGVEID